MKSRNLRFSVFVALLILSMNIYAQKGDKGVTHSRYEKSLINQITGKVNPVDVFQAQEQLKNMNSSKFIDLDWQFHGPINITTNISAVLQDNRDESGKTIYVAGSSGGIWKTTNNGSFWSKVNIQNQNLYVSSLTQAQDGTIYAATGNRDHYAGQGLFKSTDGENFTIINSTIPNIETNPDWFYTSKVIVNNLGHIFVVSNSSLLISTDNGETWINPFANEDDEGEELFVDVAISKDGTVYTFIDGIAYRCIDHNYDAFEPIVSEDVAEDFSEAEVVKFATGNVNDNVVYALAIDDDGLMINTYRSDDKGDNWYIVFPGGGDLIQPFEGETGLDGAEIEVENNGESDDILYIVGTHIYKGRKPADNGYYAWSEDLYMLSDGYIPSDFLSIGENHFYVAGRFGLMEKNGSPYNVNSHSIPISNFNAVSLGPDDKILAANSYYGTLHFQSFGSNESYAVPISNRFSESFETERSILNPEFIIISKAPVKGDDLSFLERSNDMGVAFAQYFLKSSMGPSSGSNYSLDRVPIKLWESTNYDNSNDYVYFIADTMSYEAGMEVWTNSKTANYPIKYTLTEDLNIHDSVAIKDNVASMFFLALEKGRSKKAALWMTREIHTLGKTPTWYQIAELSKAGVPTALDVNKDGNFAFVGMEDGLLFRVSGINSAVDSASAIFDSPNYSLQVDSIFQMEDRMVTSISIDPRNSNHVIVTLGNYGNNDYVFESYNALQEEPTFNSIQYNLPKAPVHSSLIEKDDSERIIIGSELGMYTKEGNAWTFEGGDMGAVPVVQIRQQILDSPALKIPVLINNDTVYKYQQGVENFGTIYAATHGRGVWISKRFQGIDNPEFSSNTKGQLKIYPNPAKSFINVNIKDVNNNAVINILDLHGRIILSQRVEDNDQKSMMINLPNNLANGIYVVELQNNNRKISGKFIINK